jgi:glycosyltransferase involved in cell wall biosynthesis
LVGTIRDDIAIIRRGKDLVQRTSQIAAEAHGDVSGVPVDAERVSSRSDASRQAPKRLALVISHLGPGGAQRVVTNAVEVMAERGIDLHVMVFTDRPDAYPTDPRATYHYWLPLRGRDAIVLDTDGAEEIAAVPPQKSKAGLRILRTLVPNSVAFGIELFRISAWIRRTIQAIEPDAVLSFLTQTNIMTVLATRGLRVRTIISERNDPRLQRHRPRVEFLRRIVYRRADAVTANSKGALDALQSFVPCEKLAFLPNPLIKPASSESIDYGSPTVVTVGRLVEQKGIDVLLAAWAKIATTLPDWRLVIVGGGPLEDELKRLARDLGIEDSVNWIGQVSDPFPFLRGAQVFVMTSRFEGTPNALLEAMSCGLPAVVSDPSPGPCELIGVGDAAAGLIVPVDDPEETAQAILGMAKDETLRQRFGFNAKERAGTHEAEQAIDVWLRLLRGE